jgi:putative heme-binding domain-containing protein
LLALITFQTGQPFPITEKGGAPAELAQEYETVFQWFRLRFPNLVNLIDAESDDPANWAEVLRTVPWTRGNPQRGASLFVERGCQTCHLAANALGPDLGGVADRLSKEDLFSDIVFPNRMVAPPYWTTSFQTRDGQFYTGIVAFESVDGVILQTGASTTIRLAAGNITERNLRSLSLMPSGLLNGLQPGDLADLYAYLKTLTRRTR